MKTNKEFLKYGAFGKLRQTTVSFVMPVSQSVRLYALKNSAPSGRIFIKFNIWVFSKICREKQIWLKSDKNNGYFNWKPMYCTFKIISRSVPLRMGNVSDKNCIKNWNSHFMFKNVFPKILPFWDNVGKYGSTLFGWRQ